MYSRCVWMKYILENIYFYTPYPKFKEGWQSCWISLFLLGNWNLHSLQNILFAILIIAFQILNWIDNVLWQIILGKYLLLKFFHPKIISLTSENRNHTNNLTTLGNAYIHISENIPTYLDVCISYAKWLTKDLYPFLHCEVRLYVKYWNKKTKAIPINEQKICV